MLSQQIEVNIADMVNIFQTVLKLQKGKVPKRVAQKYMRDTK